MEEKSLILFRHALAAGTSASTCDALRGLADEIVGHPHFTPERIRRLVWDRLPSMDALRWRRGSRRTIYELAMQEIAEPTASMAASLDALTQEYRTVLVAMLDVPAPPVPERELALAMRRHSVGLSSRSRRSPSGWRITSCARWRPRL